MKKLAQIGSLSKKIHRRYSADLISLLQARGFLDLRPSFLEILMYIMDNQDTSIKAIGLACALKKQTMTSHLNELEKRGYISRSPSLKDRREFEVNLTDFGEKFKLAILEVNDELEKRYLQSMSEVEMDRLEGLLDNFYNRIASSDHQQMKLL